MRRTPLRLVVTAVAAMGLLLSLGAPALAEVVDVKDKASDVGYSATAEDEKTTVLGYRDSIESGVDMRGMRVRHGKKTVGIRLKFARLDRDATVFLQFRLNGTAKVERYLISVKRREAILFDDTFSSTCTIPLKAKLGRKGTIRMTIKRSCLGNPERIKVSGGAILGDYTNEDYKGPFYSDPISTTLTSEPSWTPWVSSN